VNNGDGGGKCFFFSPGVESVLWRKNGKFKNCPISVFLMNGKKIESPTTWGLIIMINQIIASQYTHTPTPEIEWKKKFLSAW